MRPTRSLVREALFNILGDRVIDAAVVDLYAGAGSVGFEALSRGSAAVTFVERDRRACALIAETAERFRCTPQVSVVAADVVSWLRRHPPQLAEADLCFVDAPYRDERIGVTLELIAAQPAQLVILEHHRARRLAPPPGLVHLREAEYGLTHLSFFAPAGMTRREDSAADEVLSTARAGQGEEAAGVRLGGRR